MVGGERVRDNSNFCLSAYVQKQPKFTRLDISFLQRGGKGGVGHVIQIMATEVDQSLQLYKEQGGLMKIVMATKVKL